MAKHVYEVTSCPSLMGVVLTENIGEAFTKALKRLTDENEKARLEGSVYFYPRIHISAIRDIGLTLE